MENLRELKRDQLIELKRDIDSELAMYRPLHLANRWKRCGKEDCFCENGPGDGSWGNLHGPYVFATYKSRETNKHISTSLGRYVTSEEAEVISNSLINWQKYYTVSSTIKDGLSNARRDQLTEGYFLSVQEFKEMHGIDISDDTLDRDTVFFGTLAAAQRYYAAERNLNEKKAPLLDDLHKEHGVGSNKGQAKLRELLADRFYIKRDLTPDD